jgi:hypothetical protein
MERGVIYPRRFRDCRSAFRFMIRSSGRVVQRHPEGDW